MTASTKMKKATAAKATTKTATSQEITISAPNFQTVEIPIEGVSPYCQNKFSAKAREQMKLKQEAGSQGKKGTKREAKDFKECYEQAKHVSHEGWLGIPAPGVRAAMVSACRAAGFHMTRAKLAIFVEADGYDTTDNTPLIRITKGEPYYTESLVRNETGVADIRPRPMWDPGWEATIRIRFDADMLGVTDVVHLLDRAGRQVGIGEGRPDSKKSCGMGWGMFTVDSNGFQSS